MSLFSRGYDPIQEESKRQQEQIDNMGKKLFRFFIGDGSDEVFIRFLNEEPINFYEHTYPVKKGDKTYYENKLCLRENCPHCQEGNKPSHKSAFLVYDYRSFKNKDDEVIEGSIKLYVVGVKLATNIATLKSKYGLTDRDYGITRNGKEKNTSYLFDRGDETEVFSPEEIVSYLPEKLREGFDGTESAIEKLIEEQLLLMTEEDKEEVSDTSNQTVSVGSKRTPTARKAGTTPARRSAKALMKKKV